MVLRAIWRAVPQLTAANTGQKTKAVDEQVIPVVLPQNANLAVLIPERPAVHE